MIILCNFVYPKQKNEREIINQKDEKILIKESF